MKKSLQDTFRFGPSSSCRGSDAHNRMPFSLLAGVDDALRKLELLLRGHHRLTAEELKNFVQQCDVLYASASSTDIINEVETLPVLERENILETAVKLFNKVRNIQSSSYLEVKTLLKGAAVWMISLTTSQNGKVLSVMIKTLSKCGQDFLRMANRDNAAHQCFDAVIDLWERGTQLSLHKDLPPIELQVLKVCVFNSIIERIRTVRSSRSHDGRLMKKLLPKATELSQSLDVRNKIWLVEELCVLGEKCHESMEAIQYLAMAQNIMESPNLYDTVDGNNVIRATDDANLRLQVQNLKLKILLSLAFLYSQVGESLKAHLLLDKADESAHSEYLQRNAEFDYTILIVKINLAMKEVDVPKVEDLIRQLLLCPEVPFNAALTAVRQFSELALSNSSASAANCWDLFRLLAQKYQSDPDFTTIRLTQLKVCLAGSRGPTEDSPHKERASDIASRIVNDHRSGLRTLDEECFKKLRAILLDQSKYERNCQRWNDSILWSDILLALLQDISEEMNFYLHGVMLKVDALLQLKQAHKATTVAQTALQKSPSIKTGSLYFRCLLHDEALTAAEVLRQLYDFHNRYPFQSDANTDHTLDVELQLHHLYLCCYIVQQTLCRNTVQRNVLTREIMYRWIDIYHRNKAWTLALNNVDMTSSVADSKQSCKFIDMVREYFSFFLRSVGIKIDRVECDHQALKSIGGRAGFDVDNASPYDEPDAHPYIQGVISGGFGFEYLKSAVTQVLDVVIETFNLAEEEARRHIFDNTAAIEWLGDFASSFALTLSSNIDTKRIDNSAKDAANFCCDLLERASIMYQVANCQQLSSTLQKKRMKALVVCAAMYLDIASSHSSKDSREQQLTAKSFDLAEAPSGPTDQSIIKARDLANEAFKMRALIGEFADNEDQNLGHKALMIQVTTYCYGSSPQASDHFMEINKALLLTLPLSDLEYCIEVAQYAKGCSTEFLRNLVTCALQVSSQSWSNSHKISRFYRILIDLSPSRRSALNCIKEFAQLLPHDDSACSFATDDIDHVVVQTYNYAITLLDIDQNVLAEQFLLLAKEVIRFASDTIKSLIPKIEESLNYAQEAKAKDLHHLQPSAHRTREDATGSDDAAPQKKARLADDQGQEGKLDIDKPLMIQTLK